MNVLKRMLQPLLSRKVRVALTTVIASFLASWGLDVREEILYSILGTGVAVILGIAHEDAGAKSAGNGAE